ncbi:MAG: hypothetical protein JNM31_13025 [Flavobacteriales bacterium]|nr:hypothetical protein [Flavobacteriales bacterium]
MPRSLAGARHAPKDVEHYDIVNRTCALYVALRSHAWETPIAFGSEMDDGMLHWNKCPTGNMIACATVSTPTGDTALAGIPWPYHP